MKHIPTEMNMIKTSCILHNIKILYFTSFLMKIVSKHLLSFSIVMPVKCAFIAKAINWKPLLQGGKHISVLSMYDTEDVCDTKLFDTSK